RCSRVTACVRVWRSERNDQPKTCSRRMTAWRHVMSRVLILLAVFGSGCLNSALPKNSCNSTADCNDGNQCVQGVCVALTGSGDDGGTPDLSSDDAPTGPGGDRDGTTGCESFPPAACQSALGASHPATVDYLLTVLP